MLGDIDWERLVAWAVTVSVPICIPVRHGQNFSSMDQTGRSSVGTQTPTEDRSFDFPECFTPSPTSPTFSSVGTQTGVSSDLRKFRSYEAPVLGEMRRTAPKLFRRHSTGSDVYNFESSPTLMTAIGSGGGITGEIFSRRLLAEDATTERQKQSVDSGIPSSGENESVGLQLRKIADDWDRETARSRSLSVSNFIRNCRRRYSFHASS